ncbi:sigma-70 family RNA polymerase sigma factor [Paludibaculum fermentans]|uniref:sigma-70 family RNA polymerase sigma factor n=1 Tax=Paludibaculum fermentans TaxID=1473598 RepID=UPI003EC002A5
MPLDVTKLLTDWSRGDQRALDELIPLVYQDLHQRARNYLRRERPDHTLQPTAVIHEAYLRMVKDSLPEWNGRAHFYAVASKVMRQILVDHARRHQAGKRGSGVANVSLEEALVPAQAENTELVALDEALRKLAALDERKARIVEMRYFGGCTVEETASALGVAGITVMREMRLAEAWLRRAMQGELPGEG